MIKLVQKVKIIVPTNIDGMEVDNTSMVRDIMQDLATKYGGVTCKEQYGGYVMDDGELVIEDSTEVTAYVVNSQFVEAKEYIIDLGERVKNIMEQESVAVFHNEIMILV